MPIVGLVAPSRCSVANCTMPRWGRPARCLYTVGSPSTPFLRSYHLSRSSRKNQDPVFKNSLGKTLEAQRAINRNRLLRKVYDDRTSPNIFRPAIPPENLAHQHQRTESSENEACAAPLVLTTATERVRIYRSSSGKDGMTKIRALRRARRGTRARRCPPTGTSDPLPALSVSWNVDQSASRPAQYPWLEFLQPDADTTDGLSRLDDEIHSLEKYLRPSEEGDAAVAQVGRDLSTLVAGIVPHAPQVVGSRRTGMALAHSNLDLVLPVDDPEGPHDGDRQPSPMRPRVVKEYLDTLCAVEAALQKSSLFHGLHLSHGRTPAITMLHRTTGLPLRIYCAQGPPSSVEFVRRYRMEYPVLRPVYMTLRMILDAQGIFGANRSSIGPYGLLLLVVAVLKLNPRPIRSVAETLLDILRVYGRGLNLETTGVAVNPPGFFDFATLRLEEAKARENGEELPHLRGQRALLRFKTRAEGKANHPAARHLCIQDPANYLNDAGLPCVRTAELQGVMDKAFRGLTEAVDAWNSNGDGRPKSILGHVLQANFADLERMRSRIAGN
jgi:hypothetical protein